MIQCSFRSLKQKQLKFPKEFFQLISDCVLLHYFQKNGRYILNLGPAHIL